MSKKGFLLIGIMFFVVLLMGCAKQNIEEIETSKGKAEAPSKIDIKIAALKGPTAMGMVQIMDKAAKDDTTNNYEFTIAGAADEVSTGLLKGEFDIAAVPCNLASILYNKSNGGITLLGINTLSVLYIVENGNAIHSIEDLRGKTIYSTGYGTTPQYTLNYLLNAHGIDPEKDVTIEYKTEATEVAAVLSLSSEAVALLPQPYVTTVMMNNDKVRVALDIAKEWDAIVSDGSSIVTGVLVTRKEFLEKNNAAVEAFLLENSQSITFVNEKVDEAAGLIEQYDIFKAQAAKKAIPYCNITFISGEDMKKKVTGYLSILFEQNPQAIGGEMPENDFYYNP